MSREITRKKAGEARLKSAKRARPIHRCRAQRRFATFTALAGLRLLSIESESSVTYLSVFGLSFGDFVTQVNTIVRDFVAQAGTRQQGSIVLIQNKALGARCLGSSHLFRLRRLGRWW